MEKIWKFCLIIIIGIIHLVGFSVNPWGYSTWFHWAGPGCVAGDPGCSAGGRSGRSWRTPGPPGSCNLEPAAAAGTGHVTQTWICWCNGFPPVVRGDFGWRTILGTTCCWLGTTWSWKSWPSPGCYSSCCSGFWKQDILQNLVYKFNIYWAWKL